MNEERIKEVFSDEEFVKEMFSKETPEEVQAMLADKDIEVTVEDVVKARELLEKKLQKADAGEELGDDDLEDVAGGSVVLLTLAIVGVAVGMGALVGSVSVVNEKTRGRW